MQAIWLQRVLSLGYRLSLGRNAWALSRRYWPIRASGANLTQPDQQHDQGTAMPTRSRRRVARDITVLAFAALGLGGADAAPRAIEPAGDAMVADADMDVWLRRLVGRYRFDGMLHAVALGECAQPAADSNLEDLHEPYCRPIKGSGDCVAVGVGPGVQCVLSVMWVDMYRIVSPTENAGGGIFSIPGGVSYLDPSMALFGLDPGKSALQYLLVDHKGMPEGDSGFIKGNRATFKTQCVNAPALFNEMDISGSPICERIIRIDARPDAKVLHWSMDIVIGVEGAKDPYTRFEMTLRRMEAEDDPATSLEPPLRLGK